MECIFRDVWKQKHEVVHMGHLAKSATPCKKKKNEHQKAFRNTL